MRKHTQSETHSENDAGAVVTSPTRCHFDKNIQSHVGMNTLDGNEHAANHHAQNKNDTNSNITNTNKPHNSQINNKSKPPLKRNHGTSQAEQQRSRKTPAAIGEECAQKSQCKTTAPETTSFRFRSKNHANTQTDKGDPPRRCSTRLRINFQS